MKAMNDQESSAAKAAAFDLLPIALVRDAAQARDTAQIRELLIRAASVPQPQLAAYNAARAWKLVHSFLREGREARAYAILEAMPQSYFDSRVGRLPTDTLAMDEALSIAARAHMSTASSLLVSRGASTVFRDQEGMTPLMHFALHGDVRLLEKSLAGLESAQTGAAEFAMRQTDNRGWTVSMHAVVSQASEVEKRMTLDALAHSGFEFNRPRGKNGFSELHLAAGQGDTATIEQLVAKHGANPNLASSDHVTPVMAACYAGQADSVRALARLGANLDLVRPTDGLTAAHVAAMKGHVDVVRALHESGANLAAPSFDGETPADFARAANQQAAAKLLDTLQPPAPAPMADGAESMARRITGLFAPARERARALAPRA